MAEPTLPRPARRPLWLRLSIAAQVYLGIALFVVALLAVAAAAWVDAGRQARARAEREISDALVGFDADYGRTTRDLAALGTWLVAQRDLIEPVQTRDSARLARYLSPWTEVSLADSLTVVDEQGIVLSQVRTGQPFTQGPNLLDLLGVRDALSGKRASALDQDPAGRLEGRLALPIYGTEQARPVGALVLGFYVDGAFVQYRSRRPNQEIGLIYQDRFAIITLTDPEGKPWQGQAAPPEALQAQREYRATDLLAVPTDLGPYLFKFKPLEALPGARVGMYGIGVSTASLDQERNTLFATFGLGILAVALVMAVGGTVFARGLTAPIEKLDAAAQSMAQGDLSHPVTLSREDELGDLARQMESMRQQLSQALQAAQLEKSRYAAVIEHMGAAAIVTDRHFAIAALNPAAETLLRQTQRDLAGKRWDEVFVLDDKDGGGPSLPWSPDGNGGNGLSIRERYKIPQRPEVVLEVISTGVELDGQPAGHVHILQDASAQDRLVRAQDEFIMNAAHELRGPLASLRASIELLVEDYAVMGKQDLGVMLRTMQRAVVKFQGLVENLVDIGSIQARRFRVRPLPVRLDGLIASAIEQVQPLLQARGQKTRVCPETGLGWQVLADRSRITQVLINLLTNASKYGPEDQSIDVSVLDRTPFVQIEVMDRGPGISAEEQATLFQRFYRGRRAEEEGIGIGLGLAMAREIIEAHGGQIGVRSQRGEGATFWFTLRRAGTGQEAQ